MILSYCPDKATPEIPIRLPGSKSIAARAIIANAVAGGRAELQNLPDCDDTLAILRAVEAIAASLNNTPLNNIGVEANNNIGVEAHVGAAGTAFRFATALAAATPGCKITFIGTNRLSQRPIKSLTNALIAQGAEISFPVEGRSLPVVIKGKRLTGGEIEIDSTVSSQFITALMLVAPLSEKDTVLRLSGGKTVSRPYIEMTAEVMRAFGADVELSFGDSENLIKISAKPLTPPASYHVESDWSAASYLFEAASLLPPGAAIEIASLTPPAKSLQGDSRCAQIFEKLGVYTSYRPDGSARLNSTFNIQHSTLNCDMEDCPDLVPAVAVAAAMRNHPFRLTGIDNLRVKECDRIAVIADLLQRLGPSISTEHNHLAFAGNSTFNIQHSTFPKVDPHDDHRMAMAFTIATLKCGSIDLLDPACISKSFPDFLQQVSKLGIVENESETQKNQG